MRLIVTLDSRHRNAGGFLFLDLGRGQSHFYAHPFTEPFRRLGLRGGSFLHQSTPDPERRQIAACNAAAVYLFDLFWPRGGAPEVCWRHTEHRPEWALGERAAADLHHVHHCPHRRQLLVANSFMDCVDFLDETGRFCERRYLWDIVPAFKELAAERKPQAADLCHLNHISNLNGTTLLTLGNLNGSRNGGVICLDDGQFLLRDLMFPHDGQIFGTDFFVTESGTSRLIHYPGITGPDALRSAFPQAVPILPPAERPEWAGSPQWVRGVCANDRFLVVGVSQFRDVFNTSATVHAPPRLVVLDRASHSVLGTVYLPPHPQLDRPALFSLLLLDPEGPDRLDFRFWPATDDPAPTRLVPVRAVSHALERMPEADLDPTWFWSGRDTMVWAEKAGNAEGSKGICLTADLPPGKRAVLATGNRGSLETPPRDTRLWRLAGGSETHLRLDVARRDPFLKGVVELLEYDGQKRLHRTSHTVSEGKNEVVLHTHADTRSCRVALQLSGRGEMILTGLRLVQQISGSEDSGADLPAQSAKITAEEQIRTLRAETTALRQQLQETAARWHDSQALVQEQQKIIHQLQASRSLGLVRLLGECTRSPAAILRLPVSLWQLWHNRPRP